MRLVPFSKPKRARPSLGLGPLLLRGKRADQREVPTPRNTFARLDHESFPPWDGTSALVARENVHHRREVRRDIAPPVDDALARGTALSWRRALERSSADTAVSYLAHRTAARWVVGADASPRAESRSGTWIYIIHTQHGLNALGSVFQAKTRPPLAWSGSTSSPRQTR